MPYLNGYMPDERVEVRVGEDTWKPGRVGRFLESLEIDVKEFVPVVFEGEADGWLPKNVRYPLVKEYHGYPIGTKVKWCDQYFHVAERPKKCPNEFALREDRVPLVKVDPPGTGRYYGVLPGAIQPVYFEDYHGFKVKEVVKWEGMDGDFVVVDRPLTSDPNVAASASDPNRVPVMNRYRYTYGAKPEQLEKLCKQKKTDRLDERLKELQEKVEEFQKNDIRYHEGMILRDVEYTTRHFIVINVERNQLRGIVVDDIGPDALEFYDHELPLEVAREHYKPYEKS